MKTMEGGGWMSVSCFLHALNPLANGSWIC